jgi:glutamyl-tRNA reductase
MILCTAASHKKANVSTLEALAFKDKKRAASELLRSDHIQEVVFLQTCNRVEIYTVGSESPERFVNHVVKFWSRTAGISGDLVLKTIEVFLDREALKHLLQVASGLESMVIGENEILGQVRQAYVEAKKNGTIGPVLERSFMKAANVGKKVRSETQISQGLTSISSVAAHLAWQHFPKPEDVRSLVVGAGEAGTLVGRALKKKKFHKIIVANRTLSRGEMLATDVGGRAITIDAIPQYVPSIDLIIVAVSSKTLVLKAEHFQSVAEKPRKTKLLVVDISQPRCVADEVGMLPNVALRNIDDIKQIVENNAKKRVAEKGRVETIIEDEVEHLQKLIITITAQPVISELCARAEKVREKEYLFAKSRLKDIDEEKLRVVEDLTKVLTTRILQRTIENLKSVSLSQNESLLEAARVLFDLEPKTRNKETLNG